MPVPKFTPPIIPTFLPPTDDPLYDFTQYMSMLTPHPPVASLNPNQVSMMFALGTDTYSNNSPIFADLEKCKITLTGFRSACRAVCVCVCERERESVCVCV